jgi:hypothetical protein
LPQTGSPAIDAGDDSASLAFDQRGISRPQGLHSDIGAVEALVRVSTTLQWPAINATNFTFVFLTEPGLSYITEFKSTLGETSWTRLSTNLGTGGLLTNSAPVAGSNSRFFRVKIE